MVEVSAMEFCRFMQENRLKTSKKLSILDGDNQEHVIVDSKGEVFGKSTKIKNEKSEPFEWAIKYFLVS